MATKQDLYNLLNESECSEILRNFLCLNQDDTQIRVINFELRPHGAFGYLGEYFLLSVVAKQTESDEKRYEFFVKTLPVSNEGFRKVINRLGVFPKEASLYKTLFRSLKNYEVLKWHPDCYYTREDIMVMENLFNHNYAHLQEGERFSKCHVKAVLKSLASMHASCLIFEEKTLINVGEKYKDYFFESAFQPTNGWFSAGLQGMKYVASIHPKLQEISDQKFIEDKFIKNLNPMYEIVHTTKYRRVICHRDIWNKNILFKLNANFDLKECEDCLFVDFQHVRYQPPAMDVMFFIYTSTDRQFRRNFLDECLQYYYFCLSDNLAKYKLNCSDLIAWDEFRTSCDYVKLACLVLSGVYVPLTHLTADYMINLKKNDPEKFNYYLDSDRCELINEQMNKNQYFKDTLLEIVEELVEFVKDF